MITPPRTDTSWTIARRQVHAHLRAYHMTDPDVRDQVAMEILDEARRIHAIIGDRSPTEIAADVTQRRLSAWIDELIGPSNESPKVRFARGRTAVYLANLPDHWPLLMLDGGRAPEEVRQRVRAAYLDAGPDLTFSNMAPRAIDFGPLRSVADGTWRTFARWPVLRGVMMSVLFFSLLGTAFYLVRF